MQGGDASFFRRGRCSDGKKKYEKNRKKVLTKWKVFANISKRFARGQKPPQKVRRRQVKS